MREHQPWRGSLIAVSQQVFSDSRNVAALVPALITLTKGKEERDLSRCEERKTDIEKRGLVDG